MTRELDPNDAIPVQMREMAMEAMRIDKAKEEEWLVLVISVVEALTPNDKDEEPKE